MVCSPAPLPRASGSPQREEGPSLAPGPLCPATAGLLCLSQGGGGHSVPGPAGQQRFRPVVVGGGGEGALPAGGASSCCGPLGHVEDKTGCGRPALIQGSQCSLVACPCLRHKLPAQPRLETQEAVGLQGGHPRGKVGAQGWATPPSLRSFGFLFLRKVEISFLDSPVRPTSPLGQAPPLQVPTENHVGRHPTTHGRLLCVPQREGGEETVSG